MRSSHTSGRSIPSNANRDRFWANRKAVTRSCVEFLEDRRLFAISYALVPDAGATVLRISGDTNENTVTLRVQNGTDLTIGNIDNASVPQPGVQYNVPLASFDRIEV